MGFISRFEQIMIKLLQTSQNCRLPRIYTGDTDGSNKVESTHCMEAMSRHRGPFRGQAVLVKTICHIAPETDSAMYYGIHSPNKEI